MDQKYLQAHACYDRMRASYYNFMSHDKVNDFIDEFANAAFELMELDLENPFPDEFRDNAAKSPDQGNKITSVKEND